jgi:hypothetical protein
MSTTVLETYRGTVVFIHNHLPVKMEPTECSETSAFNIQTQGKYPEENLPYVGENT